ncbi:OLC1v1026980C1 [Oldenlandia corymbosa var. corymbosa]|uniref:OLC1v1026980C1 n=1 Tax=Oldenlandia corymbosa var. corymbosa TaxID=529605 RepID=A0AAV1C8P3_OLDCO|nr:OLC1v1026980C1 [Oldenlandia corymbosa var. corymbosa]
MASDDVGLVQTQRRLDDGLNHSHLVFQDTFNCGPPPAQRRGSASTSSASPVGEAKATTRELTGGFIDHHRQQHHPYFHQSTTSDFRRPVFSSALANGDRPHQEIQDSSLNWNLSSRASPTPSGDGSEEDDDVEDEDDEDDDDDDENEVDGLVRLDANDNHEKRINHRNGRRYQKTKQLSSFGLTEGDVVGRSCNTNEENGGTRMRVTVANADGELYHSQYMQGATEMVSSAGHKDIIAGENGCGLSGRKEGLYLSESGDPLRTILSDPLTGALMDDAMILPCGHSFSSGGIQNIIGMKSCYSCSKPVSEDSIRPNLSLRAAVQAFRREEEMQPQHISKRRRDRFEQGRGPYGDSMQTDHSRGRGVQFPFAVTDRVIIKVCFGISILIAVTGSVSNGFTE